MTSQQRRHVLVAAVQSDAAGDLPLLRGAAVQLRDVLLDSDIGDCKAGLPDGQALIYGRLTKVEIETHLHSAIDFAAREGATLILALLGHGFTPGADAELYLMARDSLDGVRHKAVDVGKLLIEAADNPAIEGVIGIIDTCNAAGAQPRASGLATGSRGGRTRLSLLMASAVGQQAYDFSLSRNLSDLLRAGLPDAGENLIFNDLLKSLRSAIYEQDLISSSYDGDQSLDCLWLAHNMRAKATVFSVGSRGTQQLIEALKMVKLERTNFGSGTAVNLHELLTELDEVSPSPDLIRVKRIVDNLIVAEKTISFIKSALVAKINTNGMRRALVALDISPSPVLIGPAEVPLISVADFVEFVALNYPVSEGSCRSRMTRFVVYLAAEADLDPSDVSLQEWADSINASLALNDALASWQDAHAERRLRLIVSLHYALAGDWPEAVGAWLLYDNDFYRHRDFDCRPADKIGVEEALREAVDWGEAHALDLGTTLRRIEVAAPASKLLLWRPEEVEYGQRLGVNYDVLTRWSRRLESISAARRMNMNAGKRLREIAGMNGAGCINWLAAHQVAEPDRLHEQLRAGLYTRAIGLMDHPGDNASLLELLLLFTPIVLWPQVGSVNAEHFRRVDASWELLPAGFVAAYRARWRAEDTGDPLADLRAVWDDREWLEFCGSLQPSRPLDEGASDGLGSVLPR